MYSMWDTYRSITGSKTDLIQRTSLVIITYRYIELIFLFFF